MDLFAEIADERRTLAAVLAELDSEQWRTPSLCEAWTVHDVAAHLLMPLVTPTIRVIAVMARHGMNWDRANLSLTAKVASRSNDDIVAGLREHANSHFTPPGLGPQAPLTDVIVHGQDIRRPLGIQRTIPEGRQLEVLNFLTGPQASKGFVPKGLLSGLHMSATDMDWSAGTSAGALVEGPAEALMMVMVGRTVALDDVGGEGVEILAQRLATT